jgi:hypothetical protein
MYQKKGKNFKVEKRQTQNKTIKQFSNVSFNTGEKRRVKPFKLSIKEPTENTRNDENSEVTIVS